jgi:PAS domain S-box-containing protein
MKEYFQNLIKEKGLQLSLLLIIIIVCANAVLVIFYRQIIIRSSEATEQVEAIKELLKQSDFYIFQGDVGVRGYLLQPTQQFLDPYTNAEKGYLDNLDRLEEVLNNNGFDVNLMAPARIAIVEYMQALQLIVDLKSEGRDDEAMDIFSEDRGYTAWGRYSPFINEANAFVETWNTRNQESYKNSINSILAIQIILIIITIPVLTIVYRKIVKDDKFRVRLFKNLDDSNRRYLFDNGQKADIKDENSIISSLISNLKRATNFINNITKGNHDIGWEGIEGKIRDLNRESIAGELIMMRDQMIKAKQEDDIRIWTNEGLSQFGDLIRKYQNDLSSLSDELISNIVRYIKAQQGGLFFLNDENPDHKYLELVGCYAYQRKKFMEKKIELGQGMVGQCFLEGETTYFTNIPSDYVSITSGLGETNPHILLIVPLRMNEEVVGVIEIASLKPIEKYQIDFLERLAETIASAIASVRTNGKTRGLLEQSQQQAEEMRAQEEEMRQSMEELHATQEQMHRKNEEVENLLRQASENEESMKLQMEALQEMEGEASKIAQSMRREAEGFKDMLMEILNEVPEKVFLKDARGKIYIANQKVADAHGMPLSEVIGKSDYDFVDKEIADEWRKQELDILKKGEQRYVFEDKIGGKTRILESIKKAFYIKPLNQKGLLGIQRDITDITEMEKKLKDIQNTK